ncbi:hypothetical protein ACROYT_G010761 [Oculina patagonica]
MCRFEPFEKMENDKFSPSLVILLILATCIYTSTDAQNFRRDGAQQGVNYAHFVKNPSHRLNAAVLTPCMINPCQHGAAFCRPIYNRDEYECVCKPGFTGKYCGVDINECYSSPCFNGGTCTDQVNGYVCNCPAGYTGAHCETDINECSSNPCLNGAACTDQVNGYVCSCMAGYAGVNCQTNINECSSNPCLNGAACVDQVNGYICSCQAGYTGLHCQTEICNVAPQNRVDCGYGGIGQQRCLDNGCCFDSSISGVIWCFYGNT